MAISKAIKFIRESQQNKELRRAINGIPSKEVINQLANLGFEFTMDEFEESVNMLHVKCQFEEEANELMQTAMWFRMIVGEQPV